MRGLSVFLVRRDDDLSIGLAPVTLERCTMVVPQ